MAWQVLQKAVFDGAEYGLLFHYHDGQIAGRELTSFFQSLDQRLERALNAPLRKPTAVSLDAPMELSLVGVDDVEEDLAITNLVENLQSRAKQELYALDMRIGHLLSEPSLAGDGNPFGPHALGAALRALADGLDAGVEVKITLLKLFVEHPNRALSRDQIMDWLKGFDRDPFDRSIDVRVTRLRKKLEDDPANPVYIRTVWGQGYLFSPKGKGA